MANGAWGSGIQHFTPAFSDTGVQPFRPSGRLGQNAANIARGFKMQRAQQAMMDAYETGDPQEMAKVSMMYPEASQMIEEQMKFTNSQTENTVRDTYRRIISNPDKAEDYLEQGIMEVEKFKGNPVNMRRDLSMFKEDPEEALNAVKMGYAGLDPKFTQMTASPRVSKTRSLPGGVSIMAMSDGSQRVMKYNQLLTGDAAKTAVEDAEKREAELAKALAAARKEGAGEGGRKTGFIDAGVEAADSMGGINRAIQLLDMVETGGYDAAALRAKQLFGIESADEGELSNALGLAVLKQLKPIFGSAFTAPEGERLERLSAGFGKSPAANKRILQQQLKTVDRAARRALRAAEDTGDEFSANEIRAAMEAANQLQDMTEQPQQQAPAQAIEYLRANPQFREQFKAKYGYIPEGL